MFIGYEITAAVYSTLILMLAFAVLERREITQLLKEHIDRNSLMALGTILLFFLIFSIIAVVPTEQLYFDENIYQGIALNILAHGNALWCQYGTGYLTTCYVNSVYHDPVGWSAFIAVAFAIFGSSVGTAYNLELFAGALSIIFVFLLSSVILRRKSYAVISTIAFSMMPQLFIWARTQADVDLPFMMFATLSFFLFVVFVKKKSINSLGAFAFSLVLVTYMRIEAVLLVFVFAVLMLTFGDHGVRETLASRIKTIKNVLQNNTNALMLLLVFVALLLPQLYYIVLEAENPSYGQGAQQSVVSLTNFASNINTNVSFLFGQLNGPESYPVVFHYVIIPAAILGVVLFALDKRNKNRFGILAMLLLWFAAYFLFYTAFYAGAATYGVDSRFMLSLLPASCMLAGFAIIEIGDFASRHAGGSKKSGTIAFYMITGILSAALFVAPFITLAGIAATPPSQMPQQSVILRAMNAFYGNYSLVPQNCLVFSFTPDIWVQVNRSSAQIGYLSGANQSLKQTFSQYKCVVLDYGYWCVVPPFHDSVCKYATSGYQLKDLQSPPEAPGGYNVTLYQLLNYS